MGDARMQRLIDEIVKLRIDTDIHKMVLQQFLGLTVASMPEPQAALASMHQKLADRLARVPQNEVMAELKSRLAQFFATIETSLIEMAASQGPGTSH